MKKNLKNKILIYAIESFMAKGYENTTMRSLASELGLAVGNVNYYYPKKEDIVVDYHNRVLEAFLTELRPSQDNSDPWKDYLLAEYRFMRYIATDEPTTQVYRSFTRVPSLREFYIHKHNELFLSLFQESALPSSDVFLSTVAMCTLEFELISRLGEYEGIWEFDDLMKHIFEVRLAFVHLNVSEYQSLIEEVIMEGSREQETFRIDLRKLLSE